MKNVIILGSGMAGLTAAIYASRDGLQPLVVSGYQPGGQVTITTVIENFPGFPEGIEGTALAESLRKQAERFGTEFVDGEIEKIEKSGTGFTVKVGDQMFESKTIIVATGASSRLLGLPHEEEYIGRGVHTCATCDGFFYRGKEIAVIGGGDSACEESSFLTKFASKVTIIHRKESLRASKIMQERVLTNPKIGFLWNKEIAEIVVDGKKVVSLKLKDALTGDVSEFKLDGFFLAIGHIPNTGFLKGVVDLDELGYVKTDRNMHTSVEGVFAAGDVQDHRYRQAITAAGTGTMAALEVKRYLEQQ